MHARFRARANLPADAGGGKTGDGALGGRAVAAARLDRAREGAGRADHRADRRAARARCRHRRGRRSDSFRAHDHAQAAAQPSWRALSRCERYLARRAQRTQAGVRRHGAGGSGGVFPANVNVAAALALAGIGPDRTMMEIWADPSVDRNCHTIEVDSDSARFTLAIENIPSENPRTGRITALSVVAALRKLKTPL